MATSTSFFRVFKDDSWRRTLRSDLRSLLRRKDKKGSGLKSTVAVSKAPVAKVSVVEISPEPTIECEQTSQSALHVIEGGKYVLCESQPMPECKADNEIIIRNYATGLNPIDWKSVDYNFCLPEFPWITGREMAGIVHKSGSGVTNLQPGDRVWTSTYYRDIRAGCFQEFVTVPAHTVSLIPENLSFEEAACLGVAALTAAMTLWKWLQIPMAPISSTSPSEYILIWGGSTVTGQFAVQMSALSGLDVIAVTSTSTRSLVKSLGAKHVITRDGKSNEEIVEAARAIGGDRITRGLDLVGATTAKSGLQTLSREMVCFFAPLAMMKPQEVAENVTIVNVEMKQFVLDESSSRYAEILNDLIAHDRIRLPDLHVLPGGLKAIEGGLERLKKGDMGGKKLVVSFNS